MTDNWIVYASLAAGLSSALVAGVFQAFSDFVMPGLIRSEPKGGIESMQHINRTVFRSVFLTTFLVLVPVLLVFSAFAWFQMDGIARVLIITGTAVYVLSVFGVTVAGNVPMNERLDKMACTSTEASAYWQTYGKVWTNWNHVRMIGSVITAICFLMAAVSL